VNLHSWINAYLDHLRGERGLAKNTVQAYSLDLEALAAHLGEDRDPSTIRTSAIASLQASNVARGLSAKSSARQLSAIRGLFRFLVREGAIAEDPSLPIARPNAGWSSSTQRTEATVSCPSAKWRSELGDPQATRVHQAVARRAGPID